MNTTRKRMRGGSVNFSNYEQEEIYKIMNNYLAAAYAIKKAGKSLENTVISKTTDSYKTQTENSRQFDIIIGLYSQYLTLLKNNLLRIRPPPSSSNPTVNIPPPR